MHRLLLLLMAFALPAAGGLAVVPAASGQAWPQPRGSAYLKVSHGRATAAEHYTFEGETQPYAQSITGNAFFDRSYYLYGEWGVREHLSLVFLVPFKVLTIREQAYELTSGGLGSVMVGVRLGLKPVFKLQAPRQALAANFMVTLPTGYARNRSPALGAGQADLQAVLSYGLSLYPLPGYAQAGLGLRIRSGFYGLSQTTTCAQDAIPRTCFPDDTPDYGNEWLLAAEAGASLGRWALAQALAQAVWSNQPPETNFDPANPQPTHARYLKLGLGLTLYPFSRFGISVQRFATPLGRNTLRSTDWFWGLEYRLP